MEIARRTALSAAAEPSVPTTIALTDLLEVVRDASVPERQVDAVRLRLTLQAGTTGGGMKIVVGYDGSEAAKRGLERAAQIADDPSEVVVVAVAEPYPRSGITIPVNRDPEEIARRRDDLEEARKRRSSSTPRRTRTSSSSAVAG
jgi:hypothetical protein